jgi:hypothetical protein
MALFPLISSDAISASIPASAPPPERDRLIALAEAKDHRLPSCRWNHRACAVTLSLVCGFWHSGDPFHVRFGQRVTTHFRQMPQILRENGLFIHLNIVSLSLASELPQRMTK